MWAMVALLALGGLSVYLSFARLRSERLQAERELKLSQQVAAVGNERDVASAALRETEEKLSRAAQNTQQAASLLKEKADLEAQVRGLNSRQEKLQHDLKTATAQSPKSSYSEALIAIRDLQDELNDVRKERDAAQAEVKRLNALLASKAPTAYPQTSK
jgi:chromosome segregation ATPase